MKLSRSGRKRLAAKDAGKYTTADVYMHELFTFAHGMIVQN